MTKELDDSKLVLEPKKGEDGYKVFSIRIKDETVRELEFYSKELGYSRNELINIMLDYSLGHLEIKRN